MQKTAAKAKEAAAKAKSALQHPTGAKPSVSIPAPSAQEDDRDAEGVVEPKTPKTPADEGIEFFENVGKKDVAISVYELRLDPDGGPNKEGAYVRLPPAYTPYVLRVSLDAGTPASKNGVFKTNFPLDGGAFNREHFVERKLPTDFSKPIHVDLPISHAGAFCYWVEYDGPTPGTRDKGREGYFNIDPILRTKARAPVLDASGLPTSGELAVVDKHVNLPLDGLSILTVVSKWMGPLPEWAKHFAEARDRGYTMLHYTPLQERGASDSPYSIRGQHVYDPDLFGGKRAAGGGVKEVEEVLRLAKEEYGLLSLTDVVLNHTASDSAWLDDHPEAGYSPANTPHLAPAFELDTALLTFSTLLASKGLPTSINSPADLDAIAAGVAEHIKTLDLWQFYVLDASAEKARVAAAVTKGDVKPWTGENVRGKSVVELAHIARVGPGVIHGLGALAGRFGARGDPAAAAGLVKAAFVDIEGAEALAEAWGRVVDVVNVPLYEEWEEDTKAALDGVKNRVKYTRLDEHGPRLGEINEKSPLVEPYFTRIKPANKPDADPYTYSVANNGWIWNADPLKNFALHPSKAYLRREVIVWGDCVKLRYGDGPAANPWLWEYVTEYVVQLARTFDGFRIDNCHSTPLHVGVAMLDAARVANPDLYVCAELFTGSEEMDTLFVSRLGINSLVREAGNAWDPKEFSRLLYRHGLGKPIGSMDAACMTSQEDLPPPTGRGPTRTATIVPHNGSAPHALFYDLTHDNESYADKRSAEDSLATAALVAFSYCATGSVKGLDDLYPKLLNLVGEKRRYELTGQEENSGIARAKRVVNALHTEMVLGGYEEGHVHQENDYIVMHRVQPSTQKGYLLVAHTAFSKGSKDRGYINPIKLRRTKAKFIYGAALDISSYSIPSDPTTIRGLPASLKELPAVIAPQGLDDEGPFTEVIVPESFPPGSIMLFSTHMVDVDAELEAFCSAGADAAFSGLDLVDLNVVLHRAEGEERDATGGEIGAYDIPGSGKLVYCGLEGWMHPLRHIMRYNDLGHPLSAHLREGPWALDYIQSRLEKQTDTFPALKAPAEWFAARFSRIKSSLPPFLRPKFFAIVVSTAYKAARRAAIEQMSDFVASGHAFTQDLALSAVQMHGLVRSASLDPGKPTPSLAAGLPHFTAGWARCWGRDVFISLRGLFLTTGNFDGAKKHIVAFASTLKHGLIPNLLDSVRNPRYNSRDSPWWMVQNIQDYVLAAPEGVAFLDEPVKRRFPKDDTWVPWDDARAYAHTSTVAEIIQEILQRHADGIAFREHNAGANLDMQMADAGFNIEINVDWNTGLVFGGSEHNCGTWMDKMGESQKAGTKGKPGTPRDGADVEIIGLLKSTLRWLAGLAKKGQFPFKGVDATIDGKRRLVTYQEWNDLIQASFERSFYVPLNPADDAKYDVKTPLINRRGIYKDVFRSGPGREWSDYQFRPNFPIAMTVAPELFEPEHALGALRLADDVLRGPLGMRTLDPADMQYRPFYDNANDGEDGSVAKGLNYHQGPEWGWPVGYFLRAYLHFDLLVGAGKEDKSETLHLLHRRLLPYVEHIQKDPWAGIPELTNKDGAYCHDSCRTQAWSNSCLLDFLQEVHQLSVKA